MDHSPRTDDQLEDMQRKLAFARGCADTLDFAGLMQRTSALFFKWAQADVVALILPPATEGEVPVIHTAARQPMGDLAEYSVREECAEQLAELEYAAVRGQELELIRGPELTPLHAVTDDRQMYRTWSHPLEIDGEIVGVVVLLGYTHWILSPRIRRLLRGVGPMLAEAVRTSAAVERLRCTAMVDGLTGLPNHRAFETALVREAARCRRTGRSHAMLLIDVDDFRATNQRCGRAVADAVLREVAGVLGGNVRPFDVVARVGGDEFAVLLPEVDAVGATAIGARLVEAAASIIHTDGNHISLSVGVAADEHGQLTPEALVERADEALYAARSEGRGRISLSA